MQNLLIYGQVGDIIANDTKWKSVKLVQVQFSDECSFDETNVTLNTTDNANLLRVVPYVDGTYRFYYVADSGRTVVTTYDSVKMQVRHEDSPYQVSAEAQKFSVVPLIRGSPNFGHLFIEMTSEMVKMTLINKYGEVKLLQSFPRFKVDQCPRYLHYERFNFDYSLEHDTVSLCYYVERKVVCFQYDFLGNMKLEKSMELDRDLLELTLSNEPANRGFLLMLTLEEDEDLRCKSKLIRSEADGKDTSFGPSAREKDRRIFRIDEHGKILGSMDIYKFGCELIPALLKPRLFNQGDGSYCLTMACKDMLTFRSGTLGVAKSCFSNDQLTPMT